MAERPTLVEAIAAHYKDRPVFPDYAKIVKEEHNSAFAAYDEELIDWLYDLDDTIGDYIPGPGVSA